MAGQGNHLNAILTEISVSRGLLVQEKDRFVLIRQDSQLITLIAKIIENIYNQHDIENLYPDSV
jgi:hypothetical protein